MLGIIQIPSVGTINFIGAYMSPIQNWSPPRVACLCGEATDYVLEVFHTVLCSSRKRAWRLPRWSELRCAILRGRRLYLRPRQLYWIRPRVQEWKVCYSIDVPFAESQGWRRNLNQSAPTFLIWRWKADSRIRGSNTNGHIYREHWASAGIHIPTPHIILR